MMTLKSLYTITSSCIRVLWHNGTKKVKNMTNSMYNTVTVALAAIALLVVAMPASAAAYTIDGDYSE